jgi:hypothetical protein
MTTTDWYPVAVKILGPQCVQGSVPPRDVLFLDGEISVDLIAGTFEFCETGYVGLLADLNNLYEELNGADPHAVLAEYDRRPKWSGALLSQFKMVQT